MTFPRQLSSKMNTVSNIYCIFIEAWRHVSFRNLNVAYILLLFLLGTFFCRCTHTHTYIIGHYNPSVRIIDLVSHTTYVVCVNFYISGGTYSLKSTPNDRFLRNFSWQFYLLLEFLPEIC